MAAAGPLSGITVVDLTRVLAGPFCTLVLADLGARVIKVERPDRGDDARSIGPFIGERSAYFMSLNRGKESIALDLQDEAERRIFERLLDGADVMVENFRPGALDRLGLGWEELHARHPRLILASTSGFGQTGPERARPAYDVVVQAMGGMMSITGQPGAPPTRVGTSIGDLGAGLFTAVGVIAALHARTRSGQGMRVDVSMLDCQVALLENAIARFQATGDPPGPLGSRHPSITPFQAYRARDAYLVIAAGNDALFRRLSELLGRPDWPDDPRFSDNRARTENAEALERQVEALLVREDAATWLARLGEAGIPCAPIRHVGELFTDPQVRARNMLVKVRDPRAGLLELPGNPVKLSGCADPPDRPPAPELDADRAHILAELEEQTPPS